MNLVKKMAYWGAMIGGSLYTVKFALYLYNSKGKVTLNDLLNL